MYYLMSTPGFRLTVTADLRRLTISDVTAHTTRDLEYRSSPFPIIPEGDRTKVVGNASWNAYK